MTAAQLSRRWRRSLRPDRKTWIAYLLIVGTVGLGLVFTEAWCRWHEPNAQSIVEGSPQGPLDALTLTGPSPLTTVEFILVGVIAFLRTLAIFAHKRLIPLLDLPLLGFLIAASGGATSPLDPTLALTYITAVILLRGAEVRRRTRILLGIRLLLGILAIHVIVTEHDRQRLVHSEQLQVHRLEPRLEDLHGKMLPSIDSVDLSLQSLAAVDPQLSAADHARKESILRPLVMAQTLFRRFVEDLASVTSGAELRRRDDAFLDELDQQYEQYFAARDHLDPTADAPGLTRDALSLNHVRESQWSIRQELQFGIDQIEQSLDALDQIRLRQDTLQRSSILRRATIGLALLLFALLTLRLRDNLRDAATQAQRQKSQREIELRDAETDNWIALTAGLTHGLGNDIVAYDIFLNEVLEKLGDRPTDVDAEVLQRLRFLRDSNKGRLAFLQFLETFAQQRKDHRDRPPQPPPAHIELPKLLHRVRDHLATVETADLPPAGSDPAVDRQLAKFRDLPLEITATENAAVLRCGHAGVIEFFVYELLKNALRSATGERPLRVELSPQPPFLRLRMINDVQVDRQSGTCPSCGREDVDKISVRRRRDEPATCGECFPANLQAMLDRSFEPGRGGGTGLGLFLIRYFLQTYYGGKVTASLHDPKIPEVSFELFLPQTDAPEKPHE